MKPLPFSKIFFVTFLGVTAAREPILHEKQAIIPSMNGNFVLKQAGMRLPRLQRGAGGQYTHSTANLLISPKRLPVEA